MIRVDFEISAHKEIKIIFSKCEIFGCKFHRGQSS